MCHDSTPSTAKSPHDLSNSAVQSRMIPRVVMCRDPVHHLIAYLRIGTGCDQVQMDPRYKRELDLYPCGLCVLVRGIDDG